MTFADTSSAAFETGDLTEVTTSGTDITASAVSPILGLYSALFTITDTSVRYIELTLPYATRIQAEVDIDVSALTMTNGDAFSLFRTGGATAAFNVQMDQSAGVKRIRVVYRAGGTTVNGAFVAIPANQFKLRAYCILHASTGYVRVDANTTNIIAVSGINNADATPTTIQAGTVANLDAGTSGSIKIDNFWVGDLTFSTWISSYQKGKATLDLSAKFFSSIRLEFWNGGWSDISADVLSRPDPSAEWGIRGDKITARVASPGRMQLALNNSTQNSAGKTGYYSPGHVNCRPGFHEGAPLRWVFVYNSTEYIMGVGEIGSIKPVPGRYNERNTQVIAFDFIKRLGEYDTTHTLPVLTDATSDAAYTAILNALAVQPAERDLSTGVDTFDYLFVAALGERPGALGEISRVSGSGLEYVFVAQDGTFTTQTRHDRFQTANVSAWLNEYMTEMDAPVTSEDDIIDSATAQSYPYSLGGSPETVYELDTPFSLGAGETRSFIAPYTDPTSVGKRVAVTSLDTSLVADTNYKFGTVGDGSNNSLNADLTATVEDGATAGIVTVTNGGASSGFVNTLVLTGTVYRTNNPQQFTATADGRTGNRNLRIDMPYINDFNQARSIAQYAAGREGVSRPRLEAVTFNANRNHESMLAALTVDVGDRVRVTEPQSGVDNFYFVNQKKWELRAGKLLWVTWGLAISEDASEIFILDQSMLDVGRLGI